MSKLRCILLGSALCGIFVAAMDLTSLYVFIKVLHWDHWKFGGIGYFSLSLSLGPYIYFAATLAYFLLGSAVCICVKRIPAKWFVYGGLVLGIGFGSRCAFWTWRDLGSPEKVRMQRKSMYNLGPDLPPSVPQ